MANEPIQGGPYPLQEERADGPGSFKAVVDWAAPKLNMTFATTGERDAAVTAPEDGMFCTIGSGSAAEVQTYVDGAWRPIMTKAIAGRRDGGTATIPSTTTTTIAIGPLAWSIGGIAVSGDGLQVPVDGLYSLDGVLRWASVSDTQIMQARLMVNGGTVFVNQVPRNMRYAAMATTVPLDAGDVVTVTAYNYGDPVDTSPFQGEPHLTVALVART